MTSNGDEPDHRKISSEEHGLGSLSWMVRAALKGTTHVGLYNGVAMMVNYLDEHMRHVEHGEDCEGPDLWVALDILVQVAHTSEYVETVDPDEIEDPTADVDETPHMTEADIDALVSQFRRQMDNSLGSTEKEDDTPDPAPGDEDPDAR